MARLGNRRSNMPAMVKGLVEPTIYDYEPIGRHIPAMPQIAAARPPKLVGESHPTLGQVYDACWAGVCPGCGRLLVSAVHSAQMAPDAFFCTCVCKAAHGGA